MAWLKTKVRKYYESDPRQCSTEYREVKVLMCPHCNEKFYPVTEQIKNASYCPGCGKPIKCSNMTQKEFKKYFDMAVEKAFKEGVLYEKLRVMHNLDENWLAIEMAIDNAKANILGE